MKKFSIVMFVVFFIQLGIAQSDTLQTILRLQDNRNEPFQKILPFLSSLNPKVREQTLLALANRQDSGSVTYILKFLNDESPQVRTMAAFSLGQIQDSNTTFALLNRLLTEKDIHCIGELCNAIAFTGTKSDLRKIVEQRIRYFTGNEISIALCIARFANRKIRDSVAMEYLISILPHKKSTERAMYALMRINDAVAAKKYQSLFIEYSKHHSPYIRMWSATILGNIKDSSVVKKLIELAKKDIDFRVRVNSIRALKNHFSYECMEDIISLIKDKNEHVSLTAINLVEHYIQTKLFIVSHDNLIGIFNDTKNYSSRQRGEIAKALSATDDNKYIPLFENEYPKADDLLRGTLLDALGKINSSSISPIIKNALKESNSTIQIAAISAYQNLVAKMDDSNKQQFFNGIIHLLKNKNAGVSYSIAIAFQDTMFRKTLKRTYLPEIISAYSAMNSEEDIEPMLEFIKVFDLLKDSSTIPLLEHSLNDKNLLIRNESKKILQSLIGNDLRMQISLEVNQTVAHNLDEIQKYNGAVIGTSKGDITIHFCPTAAPFTVNSFIGLVKKNFYSNLLFHRVVSNFVIQGGDPLGNGAGGPGYSIRSEVHPDYRFSEGAVGIASAGKDTEGSQFFITHCPTPHLDGRYTIFAYTKNMSVVNTIMVGDTIRSIKLIPRDI